MYVKDRLIDVVTRDTRKLLGTAGWKKIGIRPEDLGKKD
jgi:hypothetical protein